MPAARNRPTLRALAAALGVWFLTAQAFAGPDAGVAVLHAAPWSQGDEVREGAGEFEVLLQAARLQQNHRATGIVGVGDRHGFFNNGAERALRLLVLRGTPVVKLARGSDLAADPEQLFIDASGLSASAAAAVLQRCLELHGLVPACADPEHPTPRELAVLRERLQPFRAAFALATAPQVAARQKILAGSPGI
jgi:hypothetical protein